MRERLQQVGWTLIILLATTAHAQSEPAESEGPLRLTVDGEWWYGRITGFAQTPSGGNPGTTSSRRPTFGEVGIHDTNVYMPA
jgi:hypothetical protein